MAKHPLYNLWAQMRSRCKNPNHADWVKYGARGITVCPTWDTFSQFLDDMGPRPPGFTVERIDVNGGYNKDNCKWASQKDQQNNRRNNVKLEFNGEHKTAGQWSEIYNVNSAKIRWRLKMGWSMSQALELEPAPKKNRNRVY